MQQRYAATPSPAPSSGKAQLSGAATHHFLQLFDFRSRPTEYAPLLYLYKASISKLKKTTIRTKARAQPTRLHKQLHTSTKTYIPSRRSLYDGDFEDSTFQFEIAATRQPQWQHSSWRIAHCIGTQAHHLNPPNTFEFPRGLVNPALPPISPAEIDEFAHACPPPSLACRCRSQSRLQTPSQLTTVVRRKPILDRPYEVRIWTCRGGHSSREQMLGNREDQALGRRQEDAHARDTSFLQLQGSAARVVFTNPCRNYDECQRRIPSLELSSLQTHISPLASFFLFDWPTALNDHGQVRTDFALTPQLVESLIPPHATRRPMRRQKSPSRKSSIEPPTLGALRGACLCAMGPAERILKSLNMRPSAVYGVGGNVDSHSSRTLDAADKKSTIHIPGLPGVEFRPWSFLPFGFSCCSSAYQPATSLASL
ncbi:uncharacterized protein CLUP02_00223 [Colletotrichum lupini]|uniref:Uncharacterized protein n=1 Tax=Colletotrichum lupini TaxID=145971 RepID=A0A9Q8SAK1_9PEZI|nr:uncharacterized protein CLUP02_00223 [Colletotrichum lupini]UQC73578.1 hypothetical protein CLUP02_00223 [Colletotrichum lupini]